MMEYISDLGYQIVAAFSVPGTGEIYLTLAFIFTTVMVLGLLLRSAWDWKIKGFAIGISTIFYMLTYFSIIGMQGWPTKVKIPSDVEMVWAHVETPNKMIGKEGFIVLWVIDKNDQTIGKKPRAHIIPYDKETHKKIDEAKKEKQQGRQSGIKREGQKTKGQKMRPSDSEEENDMMFYRLPPPEVPTK